MKPPTMEQLLEDSTTLYNKVRDESKEVAIYTIAIALLKAYETGADTIFNDIDQKVKLAKATSITRA